MKRKCDVEGCEKEACVREVVIRGGQATERHLCQEHAQQQGLVTGAHAPISELLTKFVISHGAGTRAGASPGATCPQCGLSYAEFRKRGLLGCQHCYDAFAEQLGPLLERAHEGATHHVGKVPRRAGRSTDRQERIAWLRRQLQEAVEAEQYERAAGLRDDLRTYESGGNAGGGQAPREPGGAA